MSDALEEKIQKRLKEALLALPQPASREQVQTVTMDILKEELAMVNVPPALMDLAMRLANAPKT